MNFFEQLINEVANIGTQTVTGGLVGFEKGGFKEGLLVDGTKEITGAKAAEEANQMAREQFESARAQAEQDRIDGIAQKGKVEMSKSLNAAGSRAAARSTAIGMKEAGNSFSLLGSDERDFLGL